MLVKSSFDLQILIADCFVPNRVMRILSLGEEIFCHLWAKIIKVLTFALEENLLL